jgi:hypothetical protein
MGLGWDTDYFTKPVVVRSYKLNRSRTEETARAMNKAIFTMGLSLAFGGSSFEKSRMESEISELMEHGYSISGQSSTGEKTFITFVKNATEVRQKRPSSKKLFKK